MDPIRSRILALLAEIAPEVPSDEVDPDADLRDQLDIDSMDLHHLAGRIFEEFGVDVPEADRAELTTVRRCAAYVQAHTPSHA